jgi:hypothetical protein
MEGLLWRKKAINAEEYAFHLEKSASWGQQYAMHEMAGERGNVCSGVR